MTYGDLLLLERTNGSAEKVADTLQTLVSLRQQLAADFPSNKAYAISLAYYRLELCEHMQIAGYLDGAHRARQGIAESARRGLAAEWTDARLLNNMAWTLASRAQSSPPEKALARDLANRAVSLARSAGVYWNTLGVAFYRNQEWSEARTALEESMRLRHGGDANDWLFLAMTFHRLDEPDKARDWFDRSLVWIKSHAADDRFLMEVRDEAAALLGAATTGAGCIPNGIDASSSP